MSEEWGPWADHDGKGYPVPIGTTVQFMRRDGVSGIVKIYGYGARCGASAWDWSQRWYMVFPECAVIRYRIRKPRALLDMIEMVENLPEEVDA